MDNLIKIDEEKLSEYLEIWFNEADPTKDHFWNRNKVGKVIKKYLKILGKWKNKGRGNPKKGYKVYIENKKKKEEW